MAFAPVVMYTELRIQQSVGDVKFLMRASERLVEKVVLALKQLANRLQLMSAASAAFSESWAYLLGGRCAWCAACAKVELQDHGCDMCLRQTVSAAVKSLSAFGSIFQEPCTCSG